MSVSCHLYPCRSDNYGVLVRDESSGRVALIDVPEEAATRKAIAETGWTPTDIFITHHHRDHIDGVGGIRSSYDVRVVGNAADAQRLPRLDTAVRPGDTVTLGDAEFEVLDTPGHTVGHIAYISRTDKLAFVGDTLFALGCGRMFEGTPSQFFASLQVLAALDPETMIYCGHEYTEANARFAVHLSPDDDALLAHVDQIVQKRGQGLATVPTELTTELAFNPFLKAGTADAFAQLRAAKDHF
ncbi:MAG: hydroxyacylglutathione hydrolase [Devosiaceae bacterium]|nr:hydroxyacylglutathione hydrolase [Devosiaceae bacterium MH13]